MASSSSGGESNDGNHNLDWSATSLSSSNFSIGGGRPDGSFNFFQGLHQPPASYEDFTWPSPFNLQDAPSHSYLSPPSSHEAPPVPSSSWFPSLFPSTTSTSSLPPPPSLPPSAPTPLLDSTEQSLFSTFLTTLDIDPKFLFNPVLPPGMPSPPNLGMVPGNEDNWREEGREREELGKSVGGMGLSEERDYDEGGGITIETTTMKRQGRGREMQEGQSVYREDDGEEEIETPQGGDQDDSDFDPTREEGDYTETRRPRGGGGESRPLGTTRRKSRSGGVSGSATNLDRERGGKKLRISPQPTTTNLDEGNVPIVQEDDEDAIMEESEELEREEDDPDYSERVPPPPPLPPHALSTTRSKRARPPATAASSRRNSASSSSATTSTTTASTTPNPRRPSLSKPLAPPPPPPSTKVLPRQPLLDNNPPQHLSHSQKRQNHIESEQRRRNAIKLNFKDLVELVIRGQSLSRVILGADLPEEEDAEGSEEEEGGGGRIGRGGKKRAVVKKGKRASATTTGGGPGRGRGRKGDTGANASKSVVLERAKDYICWLEKGNRALEREVQRVKALLAGDQ
ncbi:hypothetical protein JCM16303_002285 [Sporobolomyces ruberrimus]